MVQRSVLQSRTVQMTKARGSNHASAPHGSVSSWLLLRNETSDPQNHNNKVVFKLRVTSAGFFFIPTASVLFCLHVGIQCLYWHEAIRTYLHNQWEVICFNFLQRKDRDNRWEKEWILTLSKLFFFPSPKAMKKAFRKIQGWANKYSICIISPSRLHTTE